MNPIVNAPQRFCAFLLAALVTLLSVAAYAYVGASNADDTYIYMRYAENLLAGHGAKFNLPEASHGITSPAWFATGSLASLLFGNSITTWKTTSGLFFVLFLVGVARFGFEVNRGSPVRAMLLLLLCASDPFLFRWSFTGMENSLVACWLWTTFSLYTANESRKDCALGLLVGSLAFLRPEFALLSLLIAGCFLRRSFVDHSVFRIRIFACSVLSAFLLCAGLVYSAFGYVVPQTAVAKALVLVQSNPLYAARQAGQIVVVVAACATAFAVLCLRPWRFSLNGELASDARSLLFVSALFSLIVFGYVAYQNHLVSSRYSVTLGLPLLLAVALSLGHLNPSRELSIRVVSCFALLQGAISGYALYLMYPGTRTDEGRDIAKFVERCIEPISGDVRIALTEIGALGFYSKRYVVDLVGLVDRESLRYMREKGRPREGDELVSMLWARQASHYVETFASASSRLANPHMEVVCEAPVGRNNVSGASVQTLWRLYEVRKAPTSKAGA